MKYTLRGHDRDNGVQEMLISLLPDEAHDRVEELAASAPPGRKTAASAPGRMCTGEKGIHPPWWNAPSRRRLTARNTSGC